MDSYESMSPWDRCITRGPLLMLPAGYNNGTHIVQTPGYVVIESEMIHEARIVPLDGRAHADPRMRRWTGEPRGHWEGDTLVVESTNSPTRAGCRHTPARAASAACPNSEALHLVERFTLTAPDTLAYQVTVDDPAIYTSPWTVSLLLRRDPEYQVFEYACHEGNQAIELALRGAGSRSARRSPRRNADPRSGATG